MIPTSSMFSGGVFSRLGRPQTDAPSLYLGGSANMANAYQNSFQGGAADDEENDAYQYQAPRYAVNVDRVPQQDLYRRGRDPVARQLDATMNYSANPRTGRIEKGMYRGMTPAEAALSARREVENQRRNTIGNVDTGRIGTDRADYGSSGGGGEARYGTPIERASTGLNQLNQQAREANASVNRFAAGDRKGFSVWKNNGDGTATTGAYDEKGQFQGKRSDIVPRIRPGETRSVEAGAAMPKAGPGVELDIEGMPNGMTKYRGIPKRS